MKSPVAVPAPILRRGLAALVDLTAIALGVALLWWMGVGRLRWPSGPYDWIDELGTLAGEHLDRLGPPLLAWIAVTAAWQLGGRLAGRGSSVGERLLGLRLLNRSGDAPHPLRVCLRVLMGIVTAWPLGWWFCLIDPARQTWADRLSGARLVRRNRRPDSL